MKKLGLVAIVLFGSAMASISSVSAEEGGATSVQESSVLLKDPFSSMTEAEREKTGITKLGLEEQEALTKWWYQHKALPHHQHISKEESISSVRDGGKYITLSDGTTFSFSSSKRKKTSHWDVGDSIGIGEGGRKGAVTLYHMASGAKVKGKRDQSPKHVSP